MKIWLKFCFILGLCVQLNACATSSVKLPPSLEEQEARWEKFITHTIAENPYTLQGSFRFGNKDNTNRVNYIFWSNGDLPLRVDVMAGVGASIAKVREDTEQVLMYLVQEKRAIRMENYGEINPLVSLGMPVPLSFYEMSLLLRGGFNQVLQELQLDTVKSQNAKKEHEKYTYYFSSINMDGMVQLNDLGMPVHCEIDNVWAFDLQYEETNAMLPYRVVISSLIDDYKAILLVKERSTPSKYNAEDLIFELPKGTKILQD